MPWILPPRGTQRGRRRLPYLNWRGAVDPAPTGRSLTRGSEPVTLRTRFRPATRSESGPWGKEKSGAPAADPAKWRPPGGPAPRARPPNSRARLPTSRRASAVRRRGGGDSGRPNGWRGPHPAAHSSDLGDLLAVDGGTYDSELVMVTVTRSSPPRAPVPRVFRLFRWAARVRFEIHSDVRVPPSSTDR